MKKGVVNKMVAGMSLVLLITAGCAEEAKEEAGAGGGSGGGGSFASSDLVKAWTSNCESAAHPIVTASNHVKRMLTLNSNNSYSYSEYWYSGTCSPANYTITTGQSGTWALNGTTITFTVGGSAYSTIMTHVDAAQGNFNTDCGGTSPYTSGVNSSANGVGKTTYTMLCNHLVMPNSGSTQISNIVDLANGVLSLGAGTPHSPGVVGGSAPSSTSITFN